MNGAADGSSSVFVPNSDASSAIDETALATEESCASEFSVLSEGPVDEKPLAKEARALIIEDAVRKASVLAPWSSEIADAAEEAADAAEATAGTKMEICESVVPVLVAEDSSDIVPCPLDWLSMEPVVPFEPVIEPVGAVEKGVSLRVLMPSGKEVVVTMVVVVLLFCS